MDEQYETGYIVIRPYTKKELAKLYGASTKTFMRWLAPHKEKLGDANGKFYMIPQVKTIFKILDIPTRIKVD